MNNQPDLWNFGAPRQPWQNPSPHLIEVAVETLRPTLTGQSLVVRDGGRVTTLPFSLIEELRDAIAWPSDCETLTIPEWLAHDRGLIAKPVSEAEVSETVVSRNKEVKK